jgi:cob(I)alamin adenosyltransferase
MSIVTKTGDKGETSLMYGHRLPKGDARVDAYGCIDELTAALGLARSIATDKFISDEILAAQKDLIIVMGELATAPKDRERYAKDGFHVTTSAMVDRVTAIIHDLEKDKSLYPKDWVIPGGTPVSAALDFARATCRRAERHIAAFSTSDVDFNVEILRYLNRLSDLCWILARYVEKDSRNSS